MVRRVDAARLQQVAVQIGVRCAAGGPVTPGTRGVPRSHEIEDLEGSVHEAGCPSGGLGDVASPK
jgi:hypothetical protein